LYINELERLSDYLHGGIACCNNPLFASRNLGVAVGDHTPTSPHIDEQFMAELIRVIATQDNFSQRKNTTSNLINDDEIIDLRCGLSTSGTQPQQT
jgi:hypothetical protein